MNRRFFTLTLTLLLVISSMAGAAERDELFAKGRGLIDDNCGDCHGGTRQGLQAGIEAVKEALELGFADEKAAYQALVDGYNTLALVYAIPDSEEQQFVRGQQEGAYGRLLEVAADDAQVRFDYAQFLTDPAAKLEHFEAAANLAPKWAEARFALAASLIAAGNVEAALAEAQTAIALATRDEAERYGRRLGELFDLAGRPDEATMLREEAKRKING